MKDPRTIEEIEDDLNALQLQYLEEEDDIIQLRIESLFDHLLEEATQCDGVLRREVGVGITNWVRNS